MASASLGVLAFLPVLRNPFYADDFFRFFDFVQRGFLIGVLRPWGGHVQVVPQTVHYVWFQLFGADPRPYFALMLALHGVNVALLYGALARLTGRLLLACLGAVVWGTLPLHQAALGWFAVLGHVLATTCFLIVLRDVAGRLRGDAPVPPARVVCWGLLALVGAGSYGVGAAMAVLFPVVILSLLPPARFGRSALVVVASVPVLALLQYLAFRVLIGARIPDPFAFALKPDAIWTHRAEVLALWGNLLAQGAWAVVLGWVTPLPAPEPAARTGLALAAALFAAVGMRGLPGAQRRPAIVLIACALVLYASIAAGRAYILGSLGAAADGPAQYTSRHHYLPALLLVVAGALLLSRAPLTAARRWIGAAALAGWLALAGGLRWLAPPPIEHRDSARVEMARALQVIRRAVIDGAPGERVVIPYRSFPPAAFLGFEMFPGLAGVFMMHFPSDQVDGREVRFGAGPHVVAAAERMGGRLGGLVVPATSRAPGLR